MSNLSDKAMLVKLKRGMFDPNVMDRTITENVEHQTGVKNGGRYKKRLLAESAIFKRVTEAWSALYTYHQQHTLPWTDNGPRLLPSCMYMEYTEAMRNLRAEADKRLKVLADNWYREVQHDSARLGIMYNPEDYPSDIASRFYHDIQFLPVPNTGDFRVQIDDADRMSLERAIAEAEANITSHLITELMEPLQRMAAKLAVPADQKGGVFRNTLIENVVETAERLKKLNVNNDPAMASMLDQVVSVAAQYHGKEDMLRGDTQARQQAATEAQTTIDNIMDIFGGAL